MAELTVIGLRVVREVARRRSISAAAEHLGYTQSAVSRQVAQMERAAGTPLFTRHPRGVTPTPPCEVLLRRGGRILAELQAAAAELREAEQAPVVRLTIGAVSTAMAALVPAALVGFERDHPGASVRLREGLTPSLLRGVATGRVDVAVVPKPDDVPAGVRVSPLLDDPLFVLVSADHPLAGTGSVTPAQLADHRWIAGSADPAAGLLGAWGPSRGETRVAHVARDWVAKIGLVAAGAGVAIAPGLMLPALPASVVPLRLEDPDARRPTVLALAERRPSGDAVVLDALVGALESAAAHETA